MLALNRHNPLCTRRVYHALGHPRSLSENLCPSQKISLAQRAKALFLLASEKSWTIRALFKWTKFKTWIPVTLCMNKKEGSLDVLLVSLWAVSLPFVLLTCDHCFSFQKGKVCQRHFTQIAGSTMGEKGGYSWCFTLELDTEFLVRGSRILSRLYSCPAKTACLDGKQDFGKIWQNAVNIPLVWNHPA